MLKKERKKLYKNKNPGKCDGILHKKALNVIVEQLGNKKNEYPQKLISAQLFLQTDIALCTLFLCLLYT